MKTKLVLLTTIILIFAMIFAACSSLPTSLSNGSDSNGTTEDGTTGTVTEAEIEAAKEEVESALSEVVNTIYLDEELVAVDEAQQVATVSEEGAVQIDLSSLTAESEIQGATFDGTTLTITSAGTYVLSGTLNGAVVVTEKINDTVRIVLNGAQINTLDSQAAASLLFTKTDALRILTVADGTENAITYTVGEEATNAKGATIQSKKSSLTINGNGTLSVVAEGGEANGIAVKKSLTILSANVTVSATKNGVKADELIEIKGATLTVTAGNDGIKTDIEPEDEEEALAYASDPQAGYIYIENSTITVTAGDDGIAANSCLYIANRAEDVITVTTNGGAPATITETSSDAADGKALKVSGIVLEEGDSETLYPATYPEESEIDNYALVITGGTFVINSNDDAIHSKGNVLVTGGTFTIASGDDGVHAEYLTKITGGTLTVTKSYEGIEGASVEITGGEISVKAVDDGVNAANADLKNYDYNIVITDGVLTVNCSGDGLDSNGKLLISGGTVTVFGPENGGNSALDSENNGTTISGGTVITTCREAMDPVSSTQYKVVANVNLSANTQVTLKDASGKVIVTFTTPKTCANVLISTPDMTAGTYTLTYGNNSTTLTASIGSTGGMGFGGGQGGMQQGGRQSGGKGGFRQGAVGAEGDMTPPALPDGETPSFDGEQPPALPDGETPSFDGNQPPMMPSGEMPDFNGEEPPALPNGEMPSFDGNEPPEMPEGGMGQGGQPPMMPRGGFGQNGFGANDQTAQ